MLTSNVIPTKALNFSEQWIVDSLDSALISIIPGIKDDFERKNGHYIISDGIGDGGTDVIRM